MAHQWEYVEETSPSGKINYRCKVCKKYSCAPVKAKFDKSPCKLDLHIDDWEVIDGKVYSKFVTS